MCISGLADDLLKWLPCLACHESALWLARVEEVISSLEPGPHYRSWPRERWGQFGLAMISGERERKEFVHRHQLHARYVKLANFAEDRNAVYVTSIERIQRERAEAVGVRQSILQVIKSRWGVCEPELLRRLEGIVDADRLSALHVAALTADSPEQWKQNLD